MTEIRLYKSFGKRQSPEVSKEFISGRPFISVCIPQSQIGRRGERNPILSTIRVLDQGLGEEPKVL